MRHVVIVDEMIKQLTYDPTENYGFVGVLQGDAKEIIAALKAGKALRALFEVEHFKDVFGNPRVMYTALDNIEEAIEAYDEITGEGEK